MTTVHWAVSADDVLKAGKALFELRQRIARDEAPYRQPMLYRDYKWDDLPAVGKAYHCDMAATVMVSMGIVVSRMPAFEAA